MYGGAYFGARYFGGRYFGKVGLTVPGYFTGSRYFGTAYFGRRYFGSNQTSIPFELAVTNTPALSGAVLISGGVVSGIDFGLAVTNTLALSSTIATQTVLSYDGEDWGLIPPLQINPLTGAVAVAGDVEFTLAGVTPGSYMGGAYFGTRYFGTRYFSPKAGFSLSVTNTVAMSGTAQVGGDVVASVGISPTNTPALAGVIGIAGDLSFASLNYTSAGILYIPFRAVSGLWSSSGVEPTSAEQAWLPPQRQPMTYVDQRDGKQYCDPAWYRALQYLFEVRVGGRNGPSIPDVVSAVTTVQSTAAAASAVVAEVQQQTQANAEALFVVREVVQGESLDGSDQIPTVDMR